MKSKPQISSRWTPGHVVRRDTGTGVFEELNSPNASSTELRVQLALLHRTKREKRDRHRPAD